VTRQDQPTASATSDAVTTYSAGRRGLGLPARPVVVSGASAARFAERVAMRRRIARHKAYVAAAVAVLLGTLAWLLLLSPVLALDASRVQVTGAGTVVDVADVHAVVGEVDGTPLPRLDTIGLRDRVLEVPGVREAKVSRIWPHGLVVSLVSREPVAAVPEPEPTTPVPGADPRDQPRDSSRGGFTLLDTEGFGVGWSAAAPEGLPVVSVPVGENSRRTLTAVLTILQALPPELRAEVSSIEAATQDTVRMGLRDGKSVVWGSAGDAALKIRVLQALRAAPAAASAQEYDVSAPTLPITR
jgi:cell division protein FtsQ